MHVRGIQLGDQFEATSLHFGKCLISLLKFCEIVEKSKE